MKQSTKKLCVNAMGIALFVALALCLQVPVFQNYYLCFGYIVMGVYCFYFGAASGMTVGFAGVVLYCLLTSGLRGMPGWALGNLVIGLVLGVVCRATRKMAPAVRYTLIGAAIILSTAAAMLGVKSVVESLLYAQPMALRMANNAYAFVADVVVLFLSLPVCAAVRPVIGAIGMDGE